MTWYTHRAVCSITLTSFAGRPVSVPRSGSCGASSPPRRAGAAAVCTTPPPPAASSPSPSASPAKLVYNNINLTIYRLLLHIGNIFWETCLTTTMSLKLIWSFSNSEQSFLNSCPQKYGSKKTDIFWLPIKYANTLYQIKWSHSTVPCYVSPTFYLTSVSCNPAPPVWSSPSPGLDNPRWTWDTC